MAGERVGPVIPVITDLKPGEIFVFGSNLAGRHGAGAAFRAREQFGAEQGIGEGLTGQCYAFPTLDYQLKKIPQYLLIKSRDRLYSTARALPEKKFLLTKVGCGLAGYPEQEMAALFADAPANIVKPEGW